MALLIDNPETEKNVRALAEATGESIAEAVNKAALARLQAQVPRRFNPERMAAIREILARVDALPDLDSRTANEIIGYDENGAPN